MSEIGTIVEMNLGAGPQGLVAALEQNALTQMALAKGTVQVDAVIGYLEKAQKYLTTPDRNTDAAKPYVQALDAKLTELRGEFPTHFPRDVIGQPASPRPKNFAKPDCYKSLNGF